ncbi:MAG: DJ-1/PfpI family protein [Pirellulales bacterium]
MNRRQAIWATAATLAGSALSFRRPAAEAAATDRATIAMLLYPGFTALDLVGPHHVFSALEGFKVELVAKTADPVSSDLGLSIKPTATLAQCPQDVAVLFVPGGTTGTVRMMEDRQVLDFLKSRGETATWVTSVCTGALVLGAAGLLRGYRATTHWGAIDVLEKLGATPVRERAVQDRNRFTGGGVTAGIDFALSLAAKLKDERYAKWVQLVMEYSPAPPFKSGTPAEAGAELTTITEAMFVPFVASATAAAERARNSW